MLNCKNLHILYFGKRNMYMFFKPIIDLIKILSNSNNITHFKFNTGGKL